MAGDFGCLVTLHVLQHWRVASQRARGEECVRGRKNEVLAVFNLHEAGGCRGDVLVVAGQELQAEELVVARDETLDLVEDGEGVEGAELGLEVVRGDPDRVAVGFARFRTAGLALVSAEALGL